MYQRSVRQLVGVCGLFLAACGQTTRDVPLEASGPPDAAPPDTDAASTSPGSPGVGTGPSADSRCASGYEISDSSWACGAHIPALNVDEIVGDCENCAWSAPKQLASGAGVLPRNLIVTSPQGALFVAMAVHSVGTVHAGSFGNRVGMLEHCAWHIFGADGTDPFTRMAGNATGNVFAITTDAFISNAELYELLLPGNCLLHNPKLEHPAAIATNSAGMLHAITTQGSKSQLTRLNGAGWEFIAESDAAWPNVVLAFDANDMPHVAFGDEETGISVQRFTNGSWENLGEPNFSKDISYKPGFSFVLARDGTPFLAAHGADWRIAVWTLRAGHWVQIGALNNEDPHNPVSMALSPAQTPYLTIDEGNAGGGYSTVVRWIHDRWQKFPAFNTFGEVGTSYAGVAINAQGELFVSYISATEAGDANFVRRLEVASMH